MDELFESLTLIQTGKIRHFPVILVGTEYWKGLFDWMREVMLPLQVIAPGDLEIVTLTDDPDDVLRMVAQSRRASEALKAVARRERAAQLSALTRDARR